MSCNAEEDEEYGFAFDLIGPSSLGVFSDCHDLTIELPWPAGDIEEEKEDQITATQTKPASPRVLSIRLSQDFERGVYLWSGSVAMAKHLLCRFRQEGGAGGSRRRTALEIGAGLGLPSLSLAMAGWEVVSTDINPAAEELKASATSNAAVRERGGSITVQTYDWFVDKPESLLEASSTGRFDIVIVAECLHKTEFHLPLLETLARVCTEKEEEQTVVYFSFQERGYEEGFWSLVKERGIYDVETVGLYDETDQTKEWPVTVATMRLRRL